MEIAIVIIVVVVACLVLVAIANRSETDALEAQARAEEAQAHLDALENPPPTDRQLNFIDALIVERETEDWMLEEDPETMAEASDLISALLEQPYRDRVDDGC